MNHVTLMRRENYNMKAYEKMIKNVRFSCGGKSTNLGSNDALNEILNQLKNKK